MLLPSEGDCICIWKNIATKQVPASNSPDTAGINCSHQQNGNGNERSGPELIGSPLRCSFEMTTTTFEDCEVVVGTKSKENDRSALPIGISKWMLSQCCLILSNNFGNDFSNYPPVWIVCDGQDINNTRFLGVSVMEKKITRTSITCHDLLPDQEPALNELKQIHLGSLSTNMLVKSDVIARYTVSCDDGTVQHMSDCRSHMELECCWSNVQNLLEMPHKTSSCALHFIICPNDPHSAVHRKYAELMQLESLVSEIVSHEVTWIKHDDSIVILDELKKVLEDLRSSTIHKRRQSRHTIAETFDFDSILEKIVLDNRNNMDFSDMIWKVLRNCSSFQELFDSLTDVLDAVISGKVNPLVLNVNTRFAKLIHSAQRGDALVIPQDSPSLLQILVEMGVDKLRRDYANAFNATGIATQDVMTSLLGSTDDLESALHQLHKLQCATELLATLRMFFNPSQAFLRTYMMKAFSQLNAVSSSRGPHIFKFSVDRSLVKEILARSSPKVWQVSLLSEQGSYSVNTIWQASSCPHYDINSASPCHRDLESPFLKKQLRYCTVAVRVMDVI